MKLFAPAMILAAFGCHPAPTPSSHVDLPAAPVKKTPSAPVAMLKQNDPVVTATNQFGFKLFQQLTTKGNVMISPLSISLALRMAMNGADGDTFSQMNQALGFGGLDLAAVNANSQSIESTLVGDPEVKISVANSIWTRKGFPFLQAFIDGTTQSYQAKVSDIDFADPGAAKTINGWVSDATMGKIDAIVPDPLPNDAVMYLINAVYFKAKWVSPFQTNDTSPEPFTLADGTSVEVPMMHKREGGAFEMDGGRQGISLPYQNGSFEMVAILPAPNESPQDLMKVLAQKGLHTNPLPMGLVNLSFPKFKATFDDSLIAPLKSLGMTSAFAPDANFSKMRSQRDVQISEVRHKTYIDVTEEGTEAAAVTSIAMRATAVLANPKELKFNRPFVYLIRHQDSRQILFLGVLQNPKG